MKRKLLLLLLLSSVYLCACGNTKTEQSRFTELNDSISTESSTISGEEFNHITMRYADGPELKFDTMPMYFQQDFSDIPYQGASIAEKGGLITCLAMLDSYSRQEFVSPDLFIASYSDFNDADDTFLDTLQKYANMNDLELCTEALNINQLAEQINVNMYPVLIYIPHESIYGKECSFIIIYKATAEGNLIVRDPNKNNIDEYAEYDINGETIYDADTFILAASKSAIMYTFQNKGAEDVFHEDQ